MDELEQAWETLLRENLNPARLKQEYVERMLAACGGNKGEAARRMNLPRRTVQRLTMPYQRPKPPKRVITWQEESQ